MAKRFALLFYREAVAGLRYAVAERDTVALLVPPECMFPEYQRNAAQWLNLCEYWRTCYVNG